MMLIAQGSSMIVSPASRRLWNLLDIIAILSDDEICDPPLLFWLIEELLDSQTISACRTSFDFLESRREQYTSKHFPAKNLVILRTCNELLRRLSRAEDAAFCGRVFIFMFQSFPLGDKSSVNLRGEYHVENVTTWDQTIEDTAQAMDVDPATTATIEAPVASESTSSAVSEGKDTGKSRSNSETTDVQLLSHDELYPIFWSLQLDFNQPKRLFEPGNLSSFKAGLKATMATFMSKNTETSKPVASKVAGETRPLKRKRSGESDDLADSFNPKYLTSRDLFELEVRIRMSTVSKANLLDRRYFLPKTRSRSNTYNHGIFVVAKQEVQGKALAFHSERSFAQEPQQVCAVCRLHTQRRRCTFLSSPLETDTYEI